MRAWLLVLGWIAPFLAAGAEVPLADFARHEKITGFKLSPDGRYLAEATLREGRANLVVMRVADRKTTAAYDLGSDRRIGDYWWIGQRIVLSFAEDSGAFVQPVLTGELMGLDADSSRGFGMRYLFGPRHEHASSLYKIADLNLWPLDYRWPEVIGARNDDSRWALIQVNDPEGVQHPNSAEVDLLDAHYGHIRRVDHAPRAGHTDFVVDHAGVPRYALTLDENNRLLTFAKEDVHAQWTLLGSGADGEPRIFPEAFSRDDRRVFMRVDADGDHLCVAERDLAAAASQRTLSCGGEADAHGMVRSFDRQEVIAALYPGAPPWERLVDTDHPDRARLQALQDAFPGQIVVPVSVSDDGSKAVLFVHSDRNPGDYYLFDARSMRADYLDSSRDWIDPEQMSERRPIRYAARDGQAIHGFLTLPRGRESRGLPLVVLPHGGPFGVFDSWDWDVDAQLLASRGYAVLQVNFRGSGGYGRKFEEAGRQHWDSVMIDDISDGTRWAIASGYADPRRVCIYGASYGGYAALMSAVTEPDLYRCAIGYAGVYDLPSWNRDTDLARTESGRGFISEYIGADPARLWRASPMAYLDRLRAPVLLVHGDADTRVPYSQATALSEALAARRIPHELVTGAGEGHGFFDEDARVLAYRKMLEFLDRYIGAAAASPQAPDALVAMPPRPPS